jgi:hypothetical protein
MFEGQDVKFLFKNAELALYHIVHGVFADKGLSNISWQTQVPVMFYPSQP